MIVLNCDITTLQVDVIVNAANKTLLGGGGVDGIIHRKAGIELREECKKLNGCGEGEAKITNAYNLPCNKIIHTVGPVYDSITKDKDEILSKSYLSCMNIAEEYRKEKKLDEITLAFPCISTGAFGYPKDEASKIAINTIKKVNNDKIKIIFCCYEVADYQIYIKNVYGIVINYLM